MNIFMKQFCQQIKMIEKWAYLNFELLLAIMVIALAHTDDHHYSLFQTFRQSTFCDSFYEFFSFFLIAVRKLKTSSRRVWK